MRVHAAALLFALFFFTTSPALSTPSLSARIAEVSTGRVMLVTVPIESSAVGLSGLLLEVDQVPTSLRADASGCYCFEPQQKEFAYVQSYVHLHRSIERVNSILRRIGVPALPRIALRIRNIAPGYMPSASAGSAHSIEVDVPRGQHIVDPTLLTHELGHAVFFHLLQHFERNLETTPGRQWANLGFVEGFANFVSAALHATPVIAGWAWGDAAVRIDTHVRFPDSVPTGRDGLRAKIQAPWFSKRYPRTVQQFKNALRKPQGSDELLETPEPYLASAAFNRAFWLLSLRIGPEGALRIQWLALKELDSLLHYDDWVCALLKVAQKELVHYEVSKALREHLGQAGLPTVACGLNQEKVPGPSRTR